MSALGLRSVRKRCEATLRGVPIPDPFDVHKFAVVVGCKRGRPLTLLPKQTNLGPCGVWLALAERDYVFYEPHTSALHRDHIVLHELGHLLRDHDPSASMDDDVLAELFPCLDAAVVKRVLGRTSYTAVEEQEAEMIASLVSERAHRREVLGAPPSGGADLVSRLQSALGAQRRSDGHG